MSRHAVFNIFLSYDNKKYAVIIAAHNKHIIEMLQKRKILFSDMINTWKNKDVFVEQYRCATALYLLSMLSDAYNIKIDNGVVAPGHVREFLIA